MITLFEQFNRGLGPQYSRSELSIHKALNNVRILEESLKNLHAMHLKEFGYKNVWLLNNLKIVLTTYSKLS